MHVDFTTFYIAMSAQFVLERSFQDFKQLQYLALEQQSTIWYL